MRNRGAETPSDLFARDWETTRLNEFVRSPSGACLLGLVYGRRRQGKTTLLQTLCEEHDGFYWQAEEAETGANLASLSAAYSQWSGSPGMSFDSWDSALAHLTARRPKPTPIALDEIGRVIDKMPSLPSKIQRHLAPTGSTASKNWTRLILCGSAFGKMRRLLDGTAPLRGRATLELVVQPFDYRTAARFWGLESNPTAAFELFSYVGGTPAYRTFAGDDLPAAGDVDAWVCRRLLVPSSALFREGRVVIAEDEELVDQSLYWSMLGAVAAGLSRWSDIEAALGAGRGSMAHALRTVLDAGWLARRDDPVRRNRSTYELLEPLIRFHRIVVSPNEPRLTRGGSARRVWLDSEANVASLIRGPQMEQLAYDWSLVHAARDTFGGSASLVGPTSLPRPIVAADGSTIQDLDFAAVESTPSGARRVLAVGEVKATSAKVGPALLDRLDRVATVWEAKAPVGTIVEGPLKRVLFSAAGFTNELSRIGDQRDDVELVDLARLYDGD
jgi:uncharacterized protein